MTFDKHEDLSTQHWPVEIRLKQAEKLLEILVCPLTKATLSYDRDKQELISREAGLAYPIRDGIPIMLVDEARQLTDDELAGN